MSKKTERLLSFKDSLRIEDVTKISKQEIDKINRSEIKPVNFKKLYKPQKRHIDEKTFIIPSTDSSAITGYLFTKSKGPEAQALVVYFHDGGWMLGNMDKCRAICSNICNYTGAAVLAVDYRLAPEFKYPIPVEDCYNAFVWASQGARYWRIDPQKVFLMGEEAGGNLVAAVSRLARDRKGPAIAGQILLEPITDCRLRTESIVRYNETPTITTKSISYSIQNYQREPKDILEPSFSPLLAIDFSRLPQTLIICPEFTPLLDDSEYYAKALKSAEVPVKFLVVKQQLHGFLNYPDSSNWEDAVYAVKEMLLSRPIESINFKSAKERS